MEKNIQFLFFDEHVLEVETSVVPNLRGLVDITSDKFFAQGLLVMMESNEYITKYEYKDIRLPHNATFRLRI